MDRALATAPIRKEGSRPGSFIRPQHRRGGRGSGASTARFSKERLKAEYDIPIKGEQSRFR
jgi:hypothetical protein